jgi:DNA-binding IclR family transcriptional regulator
VNAEKREGTQSIQRVINLLRVVARNNELGLTLSQIARSTGLHVSTAHRMLSILVEEGFVSYDRGSRLYHLGIELFLLGGSAHQFSIRNLFRSCLEKIANETGDTVFLLIRSGNDVLCIDRVEGKFPIRTIPIDIGARRPLGIGAGGLALIAFWPKAQFEEMLAANALRYPQYKNLTVSDIRNLASQARKNGYVVSQGLFHEGVTSIGIPVENSKGEVIAAITVSSIAQRMDGRRRQEIVQLVKRTARVETLGAFHPF